MTTPNDKLDDGHTADPDDVSAGQEPSVLEIARQIARDALAADHQAIELNARVVQII